MKFRNRANGYTVEASHPACWTFLFGFFYFVRHGAWGAAVITFFIAVLTGGIAWFVFPFFGERIIRDSYLRKGWIEVPDILPAKDLKVT